MAVKLCLASASPRRRQLLEQIGLEFEVRPAKGEERAEATKSWRAGGSACAPKRRWKPLRIWKKDGKRRGNW